MSKNPFIFNFSTIITFIIILESCCNYNIKKSEINFSKEEQNIFGNYSGGDILIFYNDNRRDTVEIIRINKKKVEGSKCNIQIQPSNHYNIEIRHLPKDYWSGYTLLENGKKKKSPQRLISVNKFPLKNKIDYRFNFKNFIFKTDSISLYKKDTIILDKGIYTNCYVFSKELDSITVNSRQSIIELYWKANIGMIGYKYIDGEILLLDTKHW